MSEMTKEKLAEERAEAWKVRALAAEAKVAALDAEVTRLKSVEAAARKFIDRNWPGMIAMAEAVLNAPRGKT